MRLHICIRSAGLERCWNLPEERLRGRGPQALRRARSHMTRPPVWKLMKRRRRRRGGAAICAGFDSSSIYWTDVVCKCVFQAFPGTWKGFLARLRSCLQLDPRKSPVFAHVHGRALLLVRGHFQLTYDLVGHKSRYRIVRRRPSALPIPSPGQQAPGARAGLAPPIGTASYPTMHFTAARSSNQHRLQKQHINICT